MKVTPYLRSRDAYRTIQNTPRPGDRRRVASGHHNQHRASLPALGSAGYRISREVEPARIAPVRRANVSRVRAPRHGPHGPHLRSPECIGHPVTTRPHVEQSGSPWSGSADHRVPPRASFKIVLTGDVNSPAGATEWHGSVWAMLESNAWRLRARHIDVIAYTPDLVPVGALQVVPKRRTRADHPWLIQRFQ